MNFILLLFIFLAVVAGFIQGDKMKSFPYQAYILENGKHICGAAILDKNKVMTVGKCLGGILQYYTIRVGSDDPNSGGVTVTIKHIKRHPKYNETTGENDVAVVELSTPLTFNDHIQPVPIRVDLKKGSSPNTKMMLPAVSKYSSQFWKPVTLVPAKVCKERYNVMVAKDKTCFVLQSASPSMECKLMRGDPLVDGGYLVGLLADNYQCDKKRSFVLEVIAGYFIEKVLDEIFDFLEDLD